MWNFKRICYLSTSFIFYLTILTGFTYLSWFCDIGLNPKLALLPTIAARSIFEIIILAITLLIIVVIDNKLDEKTYSIAGGIDMFFIKHKTKSTYHSELGEFLVIITDKKISLIKQYYFKAHEICEFNNDNNQVSITNRIKQELFSEYQRQEREKDKEKKSGLNALDNWDGFFDDQTRRDKKIDKLLKSK